MKAEGVVDAGGSGGVKAVITMARNTRGEMTLAGWKVWVTRETGRSLA